MPSIYTITAISWVTPLISQLFFHTGHFEQNCTFFTAWPFLSRYYILSALYKHMTLFPHCLNKLHFSQAIYSNAAAAAAAACCCCLLLLLAAAACCCYCLLLLLLAAAAACCCCSLLLAACCCCLLLLLAAAACYCRLLLAPAAACCCRCLLLLLATAACCCCLLLLHCLWPKTRMYNEEKQNQAPTARK